MELFEKKKETKNEVKEKVGEEVKQVEEIPINEEQIIAHSAAPSVVMEEDWMIETVKEIEKRLEFVSKLNKLLIKLTIPKDWINFNGTAYLQADGARRLLDILGISFFPKKDDYDIIYHKDGHYTVIYYGTFEWKGKRIDEIGARSSKDYFFSRAKGKEIPPDQINFSHVVKSAYSNLIARGVSAILGLRGLPYEEVIKKIGSIEKEVKFKEKKVVEEEK
jgi:hypothetical protein